MAIPRLGAYGGHAESEFQVSCCLRTTQSTSVIDFLFVFLAKKNSLHCFNTTIDNHHGIVDGCTIENITEAPGSTDYLRLSTKTRSNNVHDDDVGRVDNGPGNNWHQRRRQRRQEQGKDGQEHHNEFLHCSE